MTVSMIQAMLFLMTTSLYLPVNDSIHDPVDVGSDDGIPSLACNEGIHDPCDFNGICSLACELRYP
jgi:hypothetical protein